jgi:hypothetical protein
MGRGFACFRASPASVTGHDRKPNYRFRWNTRRDVDIKRTRDYQISCWNCDPRLSSVVEPFAPRCSKIRKLALPKAIRTNND